MSLNQRLLRKLLRPVAWVYYRSFFGGDGAVARALAAATARWERASARGDTPLPRTEWDGQYSRGRWDCLADPQEAARYGAIAGLVRAQGDPRSVLDVGCGEGLLRRCLGDTEGFVYQGIDVSEAALERARQRARPGDLYQCLDAESFTPDRRFAAVVLNESLYYFRDPLGQARRYLAMVEPGGEAPSGVMVVSMFESPRTLAILRRLERELPVLDALRIAGRRGAWRLVTFGPRGV